MDTLFGFIAIGVLVVINIIVVAFGYGKSSQQIADLCRRMDRVEKMLFDGRK